MYDGTYSLGGYDYAYTGEFAKDYILTRKTYIDSQHHHVETEPDIYHYSFPGHTGSFILLPNKKVMVMDSNTPSGEIDINYVWQRSEYLYGKFVITTGDGTIYTFGCREETDAYSSTFSGDHEDKRLISAWKLTSIQTQTGRSVSFNYEELVPEMSVSYMPEVTIDQVTIIREGNFKKLWEQDNANDTEKCIITNETQNKYLKSINVDGRADIRFLYTHAGQSDPFRLDSIKVRNLDSTVVRSCGFSYVKPAANRRPVLLKRVHIDGEGTYTMHYQDESGMTIPESNTPGIDWYGYYSGYSSWYSHHYVTSNMLACAQNMREYRNPFSVSDTKTLMLTRMDYPTGGYTSFAYEQNQYGRVFYVSQTPLAGLPTGGLRIASVSDYDSSGRPVRTKTYEYETEDGMSSGVLLDMPRVYYHYEMETMYFSIVRQCVTSSCAVGFGKDCHIEYLRVVETITGDGKTSVNEYRYVPASYGRSLEEYVSAASSPVIQEAWSLDYHNLGSDSNEGENHRGNPLKGKLLSECNYTRGIAPGSLVHRKDYTYGLYQWPEAGAPFLAYPSVLRGNYVERTVSSQSAYTLHESGTDYGDYGQPVTEKRLTRHVNALGRTGKVEHTDSEGRAVVDTISYHPDRPAFVTGTIRTVDGLVAEATRYDYDSLSVGSHVAVLPTQVSRGTLSGGQLLGYDPELYIDSYDSYGTPTQTRDAMGNVTYYQWGYSGQYLTRQQKGGLITTWTWVPLVGVGSVTQPNGYRILYDYDSSGRLVRTRDGTGNTLNTYEYHIVTDTEE